ncbi:MAG: Fic family protein [Actinobacteria bacterium]|nr:MAG: Fic family protein [Actinomycetota bacterium]
MSSVSAAPSGWPAVRYETLPWTGARLTNLVPRRQLRRIQGPYEAAVVPEIAARNLALPTEVLTVAEEAANEVARFDADLGGEIAPFAAVLLRSESAASSQIENLTASARAIAEAELGVTGKRNAVQIVANTRAMDAALALAEQVWIGGGDLGPHGAQFVPPQQSRIEPAIADLVAFIRRDDLPVLVHGAVAHAQFETIHPFPDGNGRTGRALLHAMLRNKRLTRNVTVPVSAGLLTNTSAYFDALTAYRLGDPAPMVIRLADAAFAAVVNGRRLVDELRTIRGGWNERVTARRDSSTWRVADFLMRHPVVDAQLLTAELNIPPNNVYRYLEPLERAGVLIEFTDRRRNRAWRSAEILAALDAFAARAGKRRLSG